tara:strand:- start:294052 stop:294240 length:189 start_codon:yes stop_codon:yes gene_type:complete
MDFVDQINARREQKKLTVSDVALLIERDQRTVWTWLNKTREPRMADLARLAAAVGLKSLKVD